MSQRDIDHFRRRSWEERTAAQNEPDQTRKALSERLAEQYSRAADTFERNEALSVRNDGDKDLSSEIST
jgi:hypothetical protein